MSALYFLLNTLLTLAIYAFIIRLWMQYVRVDFYNPITQAIVKVTQPVLKILRSIVPPIGKFDTATALVVYLLCLLKTMLLFITFGGQIFNPIYLLFALYAVLRAIGYLIFWALLMRAVLSWFSRGSSPLEVVLTQLTEPLAAPIRRVIKPIGGIDFSFMAIVFILMVLNMLATDIFGLIWLRL